MYLFIAKCLLNKEGLDGMIACSALNSVFSNEPATYYWTIKFSSEWTIYVRHQFPYSDAPCCKEYTRISWLLILVVLERLYCLHTDPVHTQHSTERRTKHSAIPRIKK